MRASELVVARCPIVDARDFIAEHHSRLPVTQKGPWKMAYSATGNGETFAVALWHNPSARMLPGYWLELRRLAVKEGAPHCTASSFLQAMVRDLRGDGWQHFISYQDQEVHTGTIYKAAGWNIEYVSKWRQRDRGPSAARGGRNYRTSINGAAPDSAAKNRWAICYGCPKCKEAS